MEAKDIYKRQQDKDPYISVNEEEHGLPIYIESRSLHYVLWLENWVEKNAQQQENKEQAENVSQQTIPGSAIAPAKIAEVLDYIFDTQKSETSARHILTHVAGTLQQLLVS